MNIYNNIFDYVANKFGSFSRGDGTTLVTGIVILLFFITLGLSAYADNQNPKTTKIRIIQVIGTILNVIIGGFTILTILYGASTHNDTTDYKIVTKTNDYLNIYKGDGATIKIRKTDKTDLAKPLIFLKQWSSKNPKYVLPGELNNDSNQPYDVLLLSINSRKRTYYRPNTVMTFTSDDAKKAFEDSYARDFLTQTVTSVDEADLDITIQSNNLKQKKTVKTAKVAITYSLSDKGRKRYHDYLDNIDTQKRKEQFRNSLKEAADDDSLWN